MRPDRAWFERCLHTRHGYSAGRSTRRTHGIVYLNNGSDVDQRRSGVCTSHVHGLNMKVYRIGEIVPKHGVFDLLKIGSNLVHVLYRQYV